MALGSQRWASCTNMMRILLPSFVADVIWPDQRQPHKIHQTSYLDGLRGIAAILVFFCHYTEENHPYLLPAYGLNKDHVSSWIQMPFVRSIYAGRPMVHIFFVISGFVLSYKPIKAIRSRDFEKCYNALSSSTFRRPIRLFGPCVVSTGIIAMLIQAGFMFKPLPSISAQFWAWCDALFHSLTWPWAWDRDLRPGYDVHLWSIPIEFAHSMLLFLTLMMLARVRPFARQSIAVALLAYTLACGKWAAFEFFAGMLLAEIHIRRSSPPKDYESVIDGSSSSTTDRLIRNPFLHYSVHIGLLLAAVFAQGWPNFDAAKTPGIRWLLAHTPRSFPPIDNLTPQKFWFALQAVVMVWCSGELGFVKRLLEGPMAQYCGHVSYAVYICHGPVLEVLQKTVAGTDYASPRGTPGMPDYRPEVLAAGIRGVIGSETAFQRTLAWFLGLVVLGPVVIWAADVFWRLVDVPMIHFARRLENACLETDVDSSPRPQGNSMA